MATWEYNHGPNGNIKNNKNREQDANGSLIHDNQRLAQEIARADLKIPRLQPGTRKDFIQKYYSDEQLEKINDYLAADELTRLLMRNKDPNQMVLPDQGGIPVPHIERKQLPYVPITGAELEAAAGNQPRKKTTAKDDYSKERGAFNKNSDGVHGNIDSVTGLTVNVGLIRSHFIPFMLCIQQWMMAKAKDNKKEADWWYQAAIDGFNSAKVNPSVDFLIDNQRMTFAEDLQTALFSSDVTDIELQMLNVPRNLKLYRSLAASSAPYVAWHRARTLSLEAKAA